MFNLKHIIKIALFVFFFLSLPKASMAERFDLIAPSGTLQRGQQVAFTINIDTQSKKLTSSQIGMTYDTQFLQFVNVTPGNTFSTITASPMEGGKLLITGSDSTGFSGQGVFANVNFKLIATAPGASELCVLWAPTPTPAATSTPGPTSALPTPTALPKTGSAESAQMAGALGLIMIFFAAGTLVLMRRDS